MLQLWSKHDDSSRRSFVRSVQQDDLPAALLALDGADVDRIERCDALLDDWAELLCNLVHPDDARQCADGLRRILVRQLSFRGDVDDYYSPDNVHLTRVIERRRGMPILLSAVWIEVGRRAGIEMHGIGMPGHFIARVGGADGLLVDPFSGGCRITVKQCASIVGRLSGSALPWNDAYLDPMTCDAIVERVIRNLMQAYRRRGDTAGLYRTARMHAALRPNDAEAQLLHACLADEAGAYRLAASLYESIASDFAGTKEAKVAGRRYRPALRRAARVH